MQIIDELKPLAVPVDSVQQDPRNARKHPEANLEAIKSSLQAYGQRKPIVVNSETGYIEAGNGLWRAAKELGWKKIAVVRVKDDPAMATGYAIMDNRSALLAEWDFSVLKDLLEGLDTGSFDMGLTGFDSKAIEDLMTQFHEAPYDGLPSVLEKLGLEGQGDRNRYFVLVYKDDSERQFWLGKLGIDKLPDKRVLLTVEEIK